MNSVKKIINSLLRRKKHQSDHCLEIVAQWEKSNFAPPSPPFIKRRVLLRNGLSDCTWIETGTFMGETANFLAEHFSHVITIEPEPTLFKNAVSKYQHVKNLKILNGTSEQIFPKLIPTLSGNVCFWLDGHYSAGETFQGSQDTPICDELGVITQNMHRFKSIVVLIDDIRLFQPHLKGVYAAYPKLDFLVDWARKNNLSWYIEHDIFVAKNS